MSTTHTYLFFLVGLLFGNVLMGQEVIDYTAEEEKEDQSKFEKLLEKKHCGIIQDHFKQVRSAVLEKMNALSEKHGVTFVLFSSINDKAGEHFVICEGFWNIMQGARTFSYEKGKSITIGIDYLYFGSPKNPERYKAIGNIEVDDPLRAIFTDDIIEHLEVNLLNYHLVEKNEYENINDMPLAEVIQDFLEEVDGILDKGILLSDGTRLGDPVPSPRIVESGDYGLHGGRFGCTRTSTHSPKCTDSKHSYVYPRGVNKGKGGRYHSGIDIYASLNTDLHSILEGEVVYIDEVDDSNVGYTIIVKSNYAGATIYLKYCHLSDFSEIAKESLKDKILIKQGDIIGKTGNTGNAKGINPFRYHVHIEASTDGVFYGGKTRVDPEKFLTTKFDVNGNTYK